MANQLPRIQWNENTLGGRATDGSNQLEFITGGADVFSEGQTLVNDPDFPTGTTIVSVDSEFLVTLSNPATISGGGGGPLPTPVVDNDFSVDLTTGFPSGTFVDSYSGIDLDVSINPGYATDFSGFDPYYTTWQMPSSLNMGQSGAVILDGFSFGETDFSVTVPSRNVFKIGNYANFSSNFNLIEFNQVNSQAPSYTDNFEIKVYDQNGNLMVNDATTTTPSFWQNGVDYKITIEWDFSDFGVKIYFDDVLFNTLTQTGGTTRTDTVDFFSMGELPYIFESPIAMTGNAFSQLQLYDSALAAGPSSTDLDRTFADTIEFNYPPTKDDTERVMPKNRTRVSESGVKQVLTSYIEYKLSLTFDFLTLAEVNKIKNFYATHAGIGNDFKYYPNSDEVDYVTYEADTYNLTAKKTTQVLYNVNFLFRRVE